MAILQRLTDKSETEIHMAFECVGWRLCKSQRQQRNRASRYRLTMNSCRLKG